MQQVAPYEIFKDLSFIDGVNLIAKTTNQILNQIKTNYDG
ncbi:hypothetical protein CLV32_4203 [Pedobacter duraquae]|uniref:Uncharacterized protein n=1 Tax=Pedobacter duraquae TaxID=425511 RepID=A0A4R6ID88_9SPHI|nr:hypothetical protein CLV32_4203 [Pedobacter duraquae]